MSISNAFYWFETSVGFAWKSLRANRLRATLSLVGITIGIFAIITVFSMVDSLKDNIRKSLDDLGGEVIYVQKWPWGTGGEYPWWKYVNRPEVSVEDFLFLRRQMSTAEFVVFTNSITRTVSQQKVEAENTSIKFVSHDFHSMQKMELLNGRYFTEFESNNGSPVAVLGANLASELFSGQSPLGQTIKFSGKQVRVIGVYEPQGSSLIGDGIDENVIVPLNFGRSFLNMRQLGSANIEIKPLPGVTAEELKGELRGRFRVHRRIPPSGEDNFAINEVTLLQESIQSIFSVLTIAGLFIGGFSILVGGFGIANIMFVSVRERTGEIGIQKSLGARNNFILFQFLWESVFLCIIGGLVGLGLVYLVINVVDNAIDFDFRLSTANIILGIIISVFIGIVSGFVPALTASRLKPVDAIRANG